MPKVNPKILIWARETAGLSLEEAAKKLGIKDAYGMIASERLNALEIGENEPSRPLLLKMVKYYKRPLLTFYMESPPRKGDRGQDFRTLPRDYSKTEDYLIDTLIRKVIARQSMIRAALEDEEDIVTLDFIGSTRIEYGIESILNIIHKILKFDLRDFRSKSNPFKAFEYLRGQVEDAGIFVLLIGDLGSYHTAIDVRTFRGFAVADNLAPFIIINDNDSYAAWSFTLIHELVHLLLGHTGISGQGSEISIERFCNQVASELLLPSEELNQNFNDNLLSLEEMVKRISECAWNRNISCSMVAYKLHQLGKIEYNFWMSLNDVFREMWMNERKKIREKSRETEGGPRYYVVRKHRLGTPLIELVQSMLAARTLSTSKASFVLGVKAKNVQALFDIS